MRISLLFISLFFAGQTVFAQDPVPFDQWLDGVRMEAREQGFSDSTIAVLDTVKKLERVVRRDRNQAEFVETYDDYLAKRVTDWRIKKGREMARTHEALLADISTKYGVQARFILAIWGNETAYGSVKPGYNLFDAVATLAHDARRAAFYRKQLFAALEMLEKGYARPEQMKSSYGGAMGQPQFLPDAYLRLAVDYDGDGVRDIWDNPGDIFASIAHYLSRSGWRDDLTWGREVRVPDNIRQAQAGQAQIGWTGPCKRFARDLEGALPLGGWQSIGVRNVDGGNLPNRPRLTSALIIDQYRPERGWLVYGNFCATMNYNAAFKYALAVGILADRIWY